MSMSVKEKDKLAVQKDQIGLVYEKINSITTVLERSYGIKAIPLIDSAHDECQLVLQPTGEPVGTTHYYDTQDMLEVDAEHEAAHLADFLVRHVINKCQG
ncbi:hypothetical protein Alches_17550 [Alicyclobacillus hesperidum subsp. aegles]|uniref:Uncharacterized protein n=1 Tax=Alicyclobacillus tolerans TaxID=90970 RepID=A0A1M6LQT6_9BACL|nr:MULTISPECIES: hypothetical protein [Alicyclobacillus]GLG01715.1 hypothetical protein Alches_17550 [Alicyclobacillus hesperidum subsp. aegles]SHJ73557.1 hypothetical protein SAMN05443507_10351 [Alicyclobacillus montanus]